MGVLVVVLGALRLVVSFGLLLREETGLSSAGSGTGTGSGTAVTALGPGWLVSTRGCGGGDRERYISPPSIFGGDPSWSLHGSPGADCVVGIARVPADDAHCGTPGTLVEGVLTGELGGVTNSADARCAAAAPVSDWLGRPKMLSTRVPKLD